MKNPITGSRPDQSGCEATDAAQVASERSRAELIASLTAERDEAEKDAHELTKALTGLVGGGSEMFIRKRERFLADIPYCVQRLRERSETAHRHVVNETLRAQAAEAERDEARQSEAELEQACKDLDLCIDELGIDLLSAEARVKELEGVLEPFARITPSGFYAEDGSEEERYYVVLHDYTRHSDKHDFTGADLARLRSAHSLSGGGDSSASSTENSPSGRPEDQSPAGGRPIASAPRDGTHVILAFGQDHSCEGWYRDDDSEPRPWCFIDTADFNEVIINRCRDGEYGPSHWQPMPYREPRNHPQPPSPNPILSGEGGEP